MNDDNSAGWRPYLKFSLKKKRGLDYTFSRWAPVAGFCEHSYEYLDSMRSVERHFFRKFTVSK
jgi:hypothetical protein